MQSAIHEGYEYQDYFTVSIILQLILCRTDAEITIDRKNSHGDKFDDLKVRTSDNITEFQIKYSDEESSHKLSKDDFANGNGHDTAFSDLFASWKNREKSESNVQIKLCLAYDSIASAKLSFVSLISKYNQHEALEYFNLCTRYLVAYGFHKDTILEQIMEPYNILFESVTENPEEERDTITKMTIALWNHTDGRVTNRYFNKWFERLLETDPKYALAFLSGFQMEHGRCWIVGEMLRSVVEKYCSDSKYLDIVISLIESLPNDTSPQIIDAATAVFKTLNQSFIRISDEEGILTKHHMDELVINIVSRFNILDGPWPENDSWKDGSIKEFLLTVESAGFDVSQYIEYFHIQKTDTPNNEHSDNTVDVPVDNQSHFDASTLEEAKKWFSELFNLHMEFDYLHRRYIAVNEEGEVVFIMKNWFSSYKGDSEYPGNAIPLYTGTELYVKKEYAQMLEQQFGKLMKRTCVQSYTLPY